MKCTLLTLFAISTILCSGQKNNGFEITGKLTNAEGKKIYLTQRGNGFSSNTKVIMFDSCIVKNNYFSFKGHLPEPNYYSLLTKNGTGWKFFILDNTSKLTIIGNVDSIFNSKVTGSLENLLSDSLESKLSPFL